MNQIIHLQLLHQDLWGERLQLHFMREMLIGMNSILRIHL